MAASRNSDKHTEGQTRLKNPSGAGTGEAGKTQTVQSSILSQSMDRISGRGGQNGSSGTLSQGADAGDSKVLSSMVQQARDTAGGTFQGNTGDGGAGDGAKQGGTFSNSMFAQSSVQPGTSVSSSSDFQVFLGPEALARGAEGLQQGQGGRNSAAGAGGRQTMSSSEMMNQFKEQFRGQLGSDVVRQARYIFKGQNSGEISMVLKPEKLGRVRIKVNLQDNSVAGKIFVENKDVEAAFNEMLDDLKEMFQEQGFDDLSVDVQLENGSGEDTAQPFRMADDNGLSGTGEQAGSFENQIAQARSYLREYESLDILA
ncbi:flagellar hook-length control protein FliK [Salinispira pacifica]|uniref:Flagellar hook-length control protein FliK n=1 Tax=Salinispira pacifica TaxID=1307761 RepID=V5WFK6_9SPIO|nr:flagellar hook-length control protein FliK [Salinispira pacifica]AHC14587.1 Flagellar hook-length control protein FliK [Salinispira pacifica]